MNCRRCNVPAAPCELVEHADGKGCCIGCLAKRFAALDAGARDLLAMSSDSIAELERVEGELAAFPDTNESRHRAASMRCVHQIYHAGLKEIL